MVRRSDEKWFILQQSTTDRQILERQLSTLYELKIIVNDLAVSIDAATAIKMAAHSKRKLDLCREQQGHLEHLIRA